jgi:hypothetical protein
MTITEIKTKVINETKDLKKLERRIDHIVSPMVFIVFILSGLVGGIIFGVKEDSFFAGFLVFLVSCVLGVIIMIIIDPNANTKAKANAKAKEISMNDLLSLFSKAFGKIVKNEQSLLTFEHHLKESMEKESITWFNKNNELTIDWDFPLKNFECEILTKKRYIRQVLVNEDLSSSNKIVVEFACSTVESKDGIEELTDQGFLISIE